MGATSVDLRDREAAERRLAQLMERKTEILRNEMLHYYRPHNAQGAFHRSRANIRGLFGGNQSGKSLAGAVEIAWTCGKIHPHRPNFSGAVHARDCCVDFAHVQQVLLPTYRKLLPRHPCKLEGKTFEGKERYWPGLKHYDFDKAYNAQDKVLTFADESFVEFKSYDQGYTKFGGSQRHVIRMDEEPDEAIFNENIARQTIYETNLIITLTPLEYSQWLYNRIFEAGVGDSRIDTFKMSSFDNPHANKTVLKMMLDSISDPAEREARLFGEFTYLAGRVYKEYGDHNVADYFPNGSLTPPSEFELSVAIDPHPEKPTAVNWFAEDPRTQKVFVYREADLKGDIESICNQIIAMSENEYISYILMDPHAAAQKNSQDGRGEQLVDRYRKYLPGIILASKNRDLGIETVRQYVKNRPGGPRLYVLRSCPITDHQMKNYSWKPRTATNEDRKKAEVVKRDDDHPDAVRFRIMHRPMNKGISTFGGFGMKVYGNG